MSIIAQIYAWDDRRVRRASVRGVCHEPNLNELGGIAGTMLVDYQVAAADGAPREVLASILTGLAGCHLAMSRCIEAMDWDPRPQPGKPSHAEGTRLEGLLLLEIANAAVEGRDYRGVRSFEFDREAIAHALGAVALAFNAWASNPAGNLGSPGMPVSVAQRLDELISVAAGLAGHAETLASLARAHRVGAER